MPPIDPGNVDTQVSVPTGVTAYVNFAPGVQVGPDVPGCLIVKGGYPVLLTANAAAIAAAAQGGRDGAQRDDDRGDVGAPGAGGDGAVCACGGQRAGGGGGQGGRKDRGKGESIRPSAPLISSSEAHQQMVTSKPVFLKQAAGA